MRILHVLDHSIPLHSGYTFRTRNILEQQRRMGWETCHVTGLKQHDGARRGSAALEETVDGLHFYRTPHTGSLLGSLPVLNQLQVVDTLARRLQQVVAREKPDILHAHSPALNGLAALRVARRCGLPLVYECRAFWEDAAVDHGTSSEWGLRYRLTRSLETRVFRRADAVTTICEGLRNDIVGRGVDADKVAVIPNAVDTQGFTCGGDPNPALLDALGLAGKVVLGFIGSFYAYEGIPLLLQALPTLLAANPNVHVLLVGGGPEEGRLQREIARLRLQRAVTFTGRVPHDRVRDYYNLVDIFVYPRMTMRLTELVTPLKPLEAMAQGRLVAASDVGGHRELIRDGDTGVLFKAGDPVTLVAAVSELIANRDQWRGMRERGRAYVERERSWEASVGRYRPIYEGLL
ncbi:MAG: glycosyltransferase, exosortase A system-associated [Halioglobus sp.]|nr:glycosyltransferase, exosortase A system-associated [Halioglobus sp.]